ncbi:Hsp20/alpha crystallin family protein [Candidatus Parcubacteria bacterium]|nr:Hsp20/alpha crystallin family protein [Candidatus Parcubacteria bacterium]
MTKQKKSFLDKIVSSDSDEEKGIETTNENEINNDNSENVGEKDINESRLQNNIDGNSSEKEKVGEKWLTEGEDSADEEGQLTVDVYKTKDLIVIKSIIGGVRPEDLDVSITSDMVTIKGKRNNIDNVVSDDYYYQECFWGNFSRSIILPNDIKTEGVEATIKNGILTIKLPKIEKNSSMKIEVKSE